MVKAYDTQSTELTKWPAVEVSIYFGPLSVQLQKDYNSLVVGVQLVSCTILHSIPYYN